SGGGQPVHDVVQPRPFVAAFTGFDRGPGEDRQAHDVHPGLAHQLDVLQAHFHGPLFGVVVPTDAAKPTSAKPAPAKTEVGLAASAGAASAGGCSTWS